MNRGSLRLGVLDVGGALVSLVGLPIVVEKPSLTARLWSEVSPASSQRIDPHAVVVDSPSASGVCRDTLASTKRPLQQEHGRPLVNCATDRPCAVQHGIGELVCACRDLVLQWWNSSVPRASSPYMEHSSTKVLLVPDVLGQYSSASRLWSSLGVPEIARPHVPIAALAPTRQMP